MTHLATNPAFSLNAVCPYYTMFPLEFPVQQISKLKANSVIFDPFCGRGTTNFAARVFGMKSYGIDSSPVAVAIAKSKLSDTTHDEVTKLASEILNSQPQPEVPEGEFWDLAYSKNTLSQICKLREALLNMHGDTANFLRAICLGAMHGPLPKSIEAAAYFSNQMPRTFASKPAYSVKYWKNNNLCPPEIDVLKVVSRKTLRALTHHWAINSATVSDTDIRAGRSEFLSSYDHIESPISLIITSPPYYGMDMYLEDQWIRNWFVGGKSKVTYTNRNQISHQSQEEFAKSLGSVWSNTASKCAPNAKMVVRFGSINSRKSDAKEIFRLSLQGCDDLWRITTIRKIDNAKDHRRQATQMKTKSSAQEEFDFYLTLI